MKNLSLNKVHQVYPNHEVTSLDSFFVDGRGWVETNIDRETDFVSVLDDCQYAVSQGARTFCFTLKNQDGKYFVSDFTVNECTNE